MQLQEFNARGRMSLRPCSSTFVDSVQQAGLRPLRLRFALAIGAALTLGCNPAKKDGAQKAEAVRSTEPARAVVPSMPSNSTQAPKRGSVVLVAGGDIDLSRTTGQRILLDPHIDPFSELRPVLDTGDLRFANLESPLCDLDGRTVSEHNRLVFAGPPAGADVAKRGRFEILSTANNHAWDFGLRCLSETIQNLKRVGIAHVGTDAEGKDPLQPRIIESNGQRFAFFAVTGIFNQGPLRDHEAKAYIADADMGVLARRIAKVRGSVDRVVVSVHIGEEYMHVPIDATRYALIGAVDAGADLVIGHHTHTPQRVEFHRGVPVVMSLGNLVFHEHRDHPWTGWSYLVRVMFPATGGPSLEICPYHLFDASPQRLTDRQEAAFYQHWDQISKSRYAGKRTTRSKDGCSTLVPPNEG